MEVTMLTSPEDPWVFANAKSVDDVNFQNWPETVGLFMPCWNNRDVIEQTVQSLVAMPERYPFGLVAIDGGSTDGTVEYLTAAGVPVVSLAQPRKNLMNEMAELWLGKYDRLADMFSREDRVGYLGFVHTDADYGVDPSWLSKLVAECWSDSKIGCVGPAYDDQTQALPEGLHVANCPIFVIPVPVVKALYRRHGWWIDPNYWSGTSYCDWDMQWHLKELGYLSVVSTWSRIKHFCQGTRAKLWVDEPDFRRRDDENRVYYHSKWPAGVSPFGGTT